TRSEWNFSMGSDALENVERLETFAAAIVCLAGRRAELADAFHVAAATAWANHVGSRSCGGRGNAERFELASSLRAQPLARPGRREDRLQGHIPQVRLRERLADRAANDFGRGTAGVCWGDSHAQTASLEAHVSHYTQFDHTQHRDLRVQDGPQRTPYPFLGCGAVVAFVRARTESLCYLDHHVTPGKVRGRCCISASMCPRCSVCTPRLPCQGCRAAAGRFRVASCRTAATRSSHRGRIAASDGPMPAAAISSSSASGVSSSSVKRQSASTAC